MPAGTAVALSIRSVLPGTLEEALNELEQDGVVRAVLGEHSYEDYMRIKREEWDEYIRHVSPWEMDRYLGVY